MNIKSKFTILTFVLLASPQSIADDLLDILGGKESTSLESAVKGKSSFYSDLIPSRKSAEQNIFFSLLNSAKYDQALMQWNSAFKGTEFEVSANGHALYSMLLFRNGLTLASIESLMTLEPEKIDKRLLKNWSDVVGIDTDIWKVAKVTWDQGWTSIFGRTAEIMVKSRAFERQNAQELESLLRSTAPKSWERSWVQWQLILSLAETEDDIKAAKLLKNLMAAKQKPVSDDLLNMTVGRILYQNGFLDEAKKYYQKVTKSSDFWFESQEERAWAEVRAGHPENAIAITKGLMQPAFEYEVSPETFYLRALSDLKVCDYAEVARTLDRFKSTFKVRAKNLEHFSNKPKEKWVAQIVNAITQKKDSLTDLAGIAHRVPRFALRDEYLKYLSNRQVTLTQEAEKASQLYRRSLSGGSQEVGFQAEFERFSHRIKGRQESGRNEITMYLREMAKSELAEIKDTLNQLQIVEAEVLQQLTLAEKLIADKKSKPIEAKGTTGSKAKDTLTFPYNGEIWFDEVTSYQVDIAKGCHAGGTKL